MYTVLIALHKQTQNTLHFPHTKCQSLPHLHCLRAGHPALDVVASVLSPGQPANGPSVYGPGPVRQEAVQPVQAAQLGVGVAQAVRPGRAGAVLKGELV